MTHPRLRRPVRSAAIALLLLVVPFWLGMADGLAHLLAEPPGTAAVVALAGHDDAALADHHDAAPSDAEHGCTPMSHHCSCHVSVPVLAAAPPVLPPLLPVGVELRCAGDGHRPSLLASVPEAPPPRRPA